MTAGRLLARRFKVDVSASGTGGWLALSGCQSIDPEMPAAVKVMTVFGGRPGALVVDYTWSLTAAYTQLATGAARDAGQALVEAAVAQLGDDAAVYVRWYDRNGLDEAWQGHAAVSLARAATSVPDLSQVTVVFTGDGDLTKIGNPA